MTEFKTVQDLIHEMDYACDMIIIFAMVIFLICTICDYKMSKKEHKLRIEKLEKELKQESKSETSENDE